MKPRFLALGALGAAAALAPARAFVELARGELQLSTSAVGTYDSRLLGGLQPADDFYLTVDPRLLYRREAGLIRLDSYAGLRINRYRDFTAFNSEDFESDFKLALPPGAGAPFSGTFNAGYNERSDVNYDVNRRVRERIFVTRLNSLVPVGLKTSLLLGGSFERDQRNLFSDRDAWDGSAGFKYADFLQGTDLTLSYRHLRVSTSGDNAMSAPLDQDSDLYSVALSRPVYDQIHASLSYGYRVLHRSRAETFAGQASSNGSVIDAELTGPFLPASVFPKLESSLSLGYQQADTPGINDTGGSRFIGSADVTWNARPQTQLYVKLHRALVLTIDDRTVETTGANTGVIEHVGQFLTASADLGYEHRQYRGFDRHEDDLSGNAALNYRIAANWTASADYTYHSADSTDFGANYDRSVVSVSANYTF